MRNKEFTEPSDHELFAAFDGRSTIDVSSRHLLATVLERTVGLGVAAVELGRFELGPKLGAGGMGVVYEAHDPVLGRKVALKVLRRKSGDQLRAALQEAQLMAGVVHENVVHVHEVGMDDGQAWIVMELVRGTTLSRWQRESGASWEALVDVYVSAGRGLAAAHQRGVVHGDFKPDNVLVGEGDRPEVVKVTDFGLARGRHGGGVLGGTPEYMAPEQYLEGIQDSHSEQFSFCVALFEVLTGAHPYSRWSFEQFASTLRAEEPELNGATIRQRFRRELLRRMTRRDLCWPRRPLRVPRRLRRALERGLAVDPTQRFPCMEELLAALDLKRARRARMRWSGALSAGALIGAVGTYGVVTQERASECRAPEDHFGRVWNDEVRAQLGRAHPEAVGELGLALDRYGRRWVDAHRQICERTVRRGEWSSWRPARECLERRLDAVEAVVGRLADEPRPLRMVSGLVARSPAACALDVAEVPLAPEGTELEVARVQRGLASAFADEVAQRSDDGLAKMDEVIEGAQLLGHGPLLAESLLQRGRLRIQRAIYVDGLGGGWDVPGLDDVAAAELHAVSSSARSTFLDAWIFRAKTLAVLGATSLPEDEAVLGDHALDEHQRAEWIEQRGLVSYNLAMRDPASEQGRRALAVAQEQYARSLELRDAIEDRVGRAKVLENMGHALVLQGEHEQALARYEEAIEFWRAHGDGEGYLPSLYASSVNAMMMVDPARARALAERALHVLSEDPTGQRVVLLPTILAHWGQPTASELGERAMVVLEAEGGSDPLHELQLRIFALGAVVRGSGARERSARAVQWARALVPRLGDEAVALPPATRALAWSYVGRAFLLHGTAARAHDALVRAREEAPADGFDPLAAAELELDLREASARLGDEAGAEEASRRAAEWIEAVMQVYGDGEGSPVGELRARLTEQG